ncbi:MAG: hypothetical protein ACHQ4H_01610 [Ktedonobacterales bacterium]|jgi:hypothetical protein
MDITISYTARALVAHRRSRDGDAPSWMTLPRDAFETVAQLGWRRAELQSQLDGIVAEAHSTNQPAENPAPDGSAVDLRQLHTTMSAAILLGELRGVERALRRVLTGENDVTGEAPAQRLERAM